jgi:predicted aspartyl protease
MIHGKFGDKEELFFEIELITADGLNLPIDALLDTGFSEWLAIDKQDLEGLGWSYLQEQTMKTAKGDQAFELYLGIVEFDRQQLTIPVHVGNGLSEFLLGRQWLTNRRLVVDNQANLLTLGD